MEKTKDETEIVSKIDDILTRGVGGFVDPENVFRKKLIAKATGVSKEDIIIKFGVDPTRPDIHLGHAVVLHKLRQMQDLGCKIIFLAGDFTAMIGDPTGKSKSRPEIDQKAMTENMQSYVNQIPKILKIEPTVEDKEKEKNGKIKIHRDSSGFVVDSPWFSWMRNGDWFQGVTDITVEGASVEALTITNKTTNEKTVISVSGNSLFGKSVVYENSRLQKVHLGKDEIKSVSVVNLFSVLRKISYAQLVERDMFQKRIEAGEPLFMHEMLYPIIQGMDSDILAQIYGSCDLEVGGTDQTFNMLMGRTIMAMTNRPPQAVLPFNLLVGTDGKEKMSKSLNNYIGVTDEPNDMFGKVMSIPDTAIPSYLELCAFFSIDEVKQIVAGVKSGKHHPKEVKMNLAEQITATYHGKDKSKNARESFVNAFQKKEMPDDMLKIVVSKGTLLVDALLEGKLVESKTEFRRLLTDGAIRKNGEDKLDDAMMVVDEPMKLKIGKHRFVSFELK